MKIVPQLRQPAAAPHPVAEDRVGERGDHDAEDDERAELPALGHGPRRDGGGGVHEHHLKQEQRRNRRRVDLRGQKESPQAEQAKVLAGDADNELAAQCRIVAESGQRAHAAHLQGKTHGPVPDDADRVDQEVHADRVGGVLGAGEAGLDQGEPGLHEHHQETGDQGPNNVQRRLTAQHQLLCFGNLLAKLGQR